MKNLTINGKVVTTNGFFATDGRSFFILEDDKDMQNVSKDVYDILPIEDLEKEWKEYAGDYASINNWKLTAGYVGQAEIIYNERTGENKAFRDEVVFGHSDEPVKYIGNISKNKGKYDVYIVEVKDGIEKGFLYPQVNAEDIKNDNISVLNKIEHHKPFVQEARDSYDKDGMGCKFTRLEDGFDFYLFINKEVMTEKGLL